MASRSALLAGYVYPAVAGILALASLVLGFGHRVGLYPTTSRFSVKPLDAEPFYVLEFLAFAACALLAWRLVSRLLAGKNVWALRVYWPLVLALFGVFSLALYALSLTNRGCDTSPVDPGWSCWEPRATYLRVTLVVALTALFLHLVARLGAPAKTPTRDTKPKRPEETPPPEAGEEIPAR